MRIPHGAPLLRRRLLQGDIDTRLQGWSTGLSIADHEANRIVEVTDDDVALQG
jgi:hypothetical protein